MNAQKVPVTIAVVSTNLRELLAATLRSLEADQQAGLVDVWVVDNASSDGSPEMVRRDFPWVTLIASKENLDYGAAVNRVAERTQSDWIAPANEDIEVRPGAIERLLATAERHPDAAVVAPRLVLPDGSTQHSVQSFPTIPLTLVFNLGLHRVSRRLADRLCIEGYWDPERGRLVPWTMATFMLVRREAFDSIGGFDEEQWMHAEDLDLGWRLRKGGWKAFYEPTAEVFHVGSAASKKAFGDELMSRYMAASYAWLARRRSLAMARVVALLNTAGAAFRLTIYSILARLRPERFSRKRDVYRYWLGVHSVGFKSRAELLRHR